MHSKERYTERRFGKADEETIGISNDFVFCKVMQDEELLAEFIRLILPELKFTKIQVQAQRAVEIGTDIHGVRFDIFATLEDGTTKIVLNAVGTMDDVSDKLKAFLDYVAGKTARSFHVCIHSCFRPEPLINTTFPHSMPYIVAEVVGFIAGDHFIELICR